MTAPTTGSGTRYYSVILTNGIFLYIFLPTNSDSTYGRPYIYIDINGKHGPNCPDIDLFLYVIKKDGSI